jgi:hypothetical protein
MGEPATASHPVFVTGLWPTFFAGYALFLGLQLMDLLTTATVFRVGGLEANPYAAAIHAGAGLGGLTLLKVALFLLTLAVWLPAVRFLDRHGAGGAWVAVLLVVALDLYYAGVVVLNLVHVLALGSQPS